jgi:phenylacetate-coenzyme A ligase PaaK-like adenylate-forming protein
MKIKHAPSFPYAEKISRIRDPLDWSDEKTALMVRACREMAVFQSRNCPEIKAVYRRHGFEPGSIRGEKDLGRIPPVGVTAMKHFLLTSMDERLLFLKLTSSGTGGVKTQIWFDRESLDRVQAMLENLWRQEGFISASPANYMMFVYDPKEAKDLGIAFSDKNQQRFAPVNEAYYTIRKTPEGGWKFDKQKAVEKMSAYEKAGKPVRILGIPGFMHEFLKELSSRGLSFSLPAGSLVMTGGGWKAAEDKKVSRDFFRKEASRLLGVPQRNIRDGYGFAEHSSPYLECARHRFHVPVYNRVFARDPVTMRILPPGETGLLEFVTPYNAMMPNLALLSTDLGYMNPGRCPCGHNSPAFTLTGRAGLSKHKGCALTAEEVVK